MNTTSKSHCLSILNKLIKPAEYPFSWVMSPTKRPMYQTFYNKIEVVVQHRLLEPIDLEIIFQNAGKWNNYYQFLHHTGLRAGDVALLTIGNINRCYYKSQLYLVL